MKVKRVFWSWHHLDPSILCSCLLQDPGYVRKWWVLVRSLVEIAAQIQAPGRGWFMSYHCVPSLLSAKKYPPCPSCPPSCTAACPDRWVGYRGKCFFFSETKESWNLSQSHCISLGASLGVIDSPAELVRKKIPAVLLYQS